MIAFSASPVILVFIAVFSSVVKELLASTSLVFSSDLAFTASIASTFFVFAGWAAAFPIAVIPSFLAFFTFSSVSAAFMLFFAVVAASDTAFFRAVASSLVKPLFPSITPFCFVTSASIASNAAVLSTSATTFISLLKFDPLSPGSVSFFVANSTTVSAFIFLVPISLT